MRASSTVLAATAAVAVFSFAATALQAPKPLMAVFAFALLASLGYVWTAVILRGRAPVFELACVAVGLVLAIPVIGGLVLQEAGLPLDARSWASLLAGLLLVGDAVLAFRYRGEVSVTALRRQLAPLASLAAGGRNRPQRKARAKPRSFLRSQAAACALAAIIAVGAVWLAQAGAASQQYPGYTELWLTGPGQSAAKDNLGVINQQGKTERYKLVLLRGGRVSATWLFVLATGLSWTRAVPVTGETKASLYLLPDTRQPYRSVSTEP